MKKELNLQLDAHVELLQDISFKSINGIKVKEIIELRTLCKKNKYDYFNRIKLKYIVGLGMLGLEYKIHTGIEKVLYSYINYLIHELPVENYDSDAEFSTM
jgi:hypothetical protein